MTVHTQMCNEASALCCVSACAQQEGGGSGLQVPWMQQEVRQRGRCGQPAAVGLNLQKRMHPGPLEQDL